MRFTVTLDEDVVAGIKSEMERSGDTFKQVLNRLIRLAYGVPHTPTGKRSERGRKVRKVR